MSRPVHILYDSIGAWEENREKVDKIIEEFTGTSDYPSTRSLPPIVFGVSLAEDGIERLRDLDGVIVRVPDEDDD